MLGYENENRKELASDTPSVPPKRQKQLLNESDIDWNLIKDSKYHKDVYRDFKHLLRLEKTVTSMQKDDEMNLEFFKINQQSQNAILFPYMHIIHFSLHLLYEELKLNTMRAKDLPLLVKFLCKLAGDLSLKEYTICYWKDFPGECVFNKGDVIGEDELKKIVRWSVMSEQPYFLMEHLYNMLCGVGKISPFPYIPNVNTRTRDIVQVI